ncbi:MAG: Mov34/MPN/PAD-1 family protein [Bacteroidales bacterium]|nr:Mov34/MPN/PAD-1 family protein [Bacteroidales bacterium]MCF8398838.1 Mov34/MPN/PAD-1 family protein [Bacteroidales bacterium]
MNEVCKKVLITTDAFNTIITESMHKHPVETGGILLGQIENGTWYVIESIEPGPESVFKQHYFEYDHAFVNYLANARARRYRKKLKLLGLWHRHPGSFDKFSATDDETNLEFARKSKHGAISGLVNIDPELRFTLYHVNDKLVYTKTAFEVSDEVIPQAFLQKKYKDKGSIVKPVQEKTENMDEIPEETLNLLILENEALEKQKLYNCEFERIDEHTIHYTCLLQKKLIGKKLPQKIEWNISFENGLCTLLSNDHEQYPYREGLFIDHLYKTAGLENGNKQKNKQA